MNHGSASAYVYHKCRCVECKLGATERARARRKLQAYGRFETKFVDAQPVREHLETLRQQGWGMRIIAEQSGVSVTQVRVLLYGRCPSEQNEGHYVKPRFPKKMLATNAERLMKLRFSIDESGEGTLVSARATHRRMQALSCLGYSLNWQAHQLGMITGNYTSIFDRDLVTVKTALRVRELFEANENKPNKGSNRHERAGITRGINRAKANKWLPPAAWDDIENDDAPAVVEPEHVIDEVKFELILTGVKVSLSMHERRVFIPELSARGFTHREIARLADVVPKTVERILEGWAA
jgi:hypothetical protein